MRLVGQGLRALMALDDHRYRCPTPNKYSYPDRRTAKQWARKTARNGLGHLLKPYACACGCWHLSTHRWRKEWQTTPTEETN